MCSKDSWSRGSSLVFESEPFCFWGRPLGCNIDQCHCERVSRLSHNSPCTSLHPCVSLDISLFRTKVSALLLLQLLILRAVRRVPSTMAEMLGQDLRRIVPLQRQKMS